MTGELPPFSGDDPTCPKCGNVGAVTRFMALGDCEHRVSMVVGDRPNERLHRECRRCDYAWDEATVEAEPEPLADWEIELLEEKRAGEARHQAEAAIERVRALHKPVPCECTKCNSRRLDGLDDTLCAHCSDFTSSYPDGGIGWPCPTLKALDRPEDHT